MPKFKSPDGRVFDNIVLAKNHFCMEHQCATCPLYYGNQIAERYCTVYAYNNPITAARLMGYEVIEDEKKTCINCKYLTEKDTCTRINTPKKVDPNLGCVMWKSKDELKPDCEQISTESNQEAKSDGGKPSPSLVPPALIRGVDAIREYGCKKYSDPGNWRRVEPQRYWEATLRHALAAWDDWKAVDEESGMPAIWHMACNLAFLMQYMEEEKDEKANQE